MGLAAVSAGLGGIGSIFSAVGAYNQDKSAEEAAKYNSQVAALNATLATQNAGLAEQEGVSQVSTQELKNRLAGGQIKAAQGANNISVNSGSALQVRQSERVGGELSSMDIMSNAARQAFGYEAQAAADTGQAGLYTAEAQQAGEAAPLAAATSLIGGASSVGSRYAGFLAQGGSTNGPQALIS